VARTDQVRMAIAGRMSPELVDALSARELERAVAVMDAHLARVEANLLGQRAEG
jgi:DNA-binding GntR family transcriptional regulator